MKLYKNAQEAFENIFEEIIKYGSRTNIGTLAIHDCIFTITQPLDNLIKTPWRNWKEDYATREWMWYLSGDPHVTEIKKYAKIWDRMHSGDDLVNSNYGYQWSRENQLDKVVEKLRNNRDTRQAWISIYDGKEIDKYSFDTPCTLSIGFRIVDIMHNKKHQDYLDMTVLMRSNDLVYGFCNDQYCFSRLQEMVAKKLGIQIGTYTHYASDMHIYEKHWNMNPDLDCGYL